MKEVFVHNTDCYCRRTSKTTMEILFQVNEKFSFHITAAVLVCLQALLSNRLKSVFQMKAILVETSPIRQNKMKCPFESGANIFVNSGSQWFDYFPIDKIQQSLLKFDDHSPLTSCKHPSKYYHARNTPVLYLIMYCRSTDDTAL